GVVKEVDEAARRTNIETSPVGAYVGPLVRSGHAESRLHDTAVRSINRCGCRTPTGDDETRAVFDHGYEVTVVQAHDGAAGSRSLVSTGAGTRPRRAPRQTAKRRV